MCQWAIYIVLGSVYIFPPADRWWEYINHSQTHECWNWDWDPDNPFLGIFVSKFRYFVFAVSNKRDDKGISSTIYCLHGLWISVQKPVESGWGEWREIELWLNKRSSRVDIRSTRVWMRSSPVVRTSESQCRSRNSQLSWFRSPSDIVESGAADEAVLSIELKKKIIIIRR